MDDPDAGVAFDFRGAAILDGHEVFVERVSTTKVKEWKAEQLESTSDVRLLGDHTNAAGKRVLPLPEAVALMRNKRGDDFPLSGEMATHEFLKAVADGPGNFGSYHAEWTRLSGVGEYAAVRHVHRHACEVLRLMHSYDQLDVTVLASAELVVRWLIQTETATERNVRHPDYSGLDIIMSAPVSASGRATTTKFNAWITDRLKERSQIWKQERLFREEKRHQYDGGKDNDGWKGKGKGEGKDKDKGRPKKKKTRAGAEDAGEEE